MFRLKKRHEYFIYFAVMQNGSEIAEGNFIHSTLVKLHHGNSDAHFNESHKFVLDEWFEGKDTSNMKVILRNVSYLGSTRRY